MKTLPDNFGQFDFVPCFLIYGPFGSGKTFSIGTLPDPILYIGTEPRDPRVVLRYHKHKKFTWRFPENFDEIMNLLSTIKRRIDQKQFNYKSVAFDSLSFCQGLFKLKLEDDRYLARLSVDKAREGLIDRFRIDEADWGPVASVMKRITTALNLLSQSGVIVVATASEMEHPKWNRELVAAPAFQGKEFSMLVNGYFDFIGYIEQPWYVEEDSQTGEKKIHPSIVSFVSPPDSPYVAKCCSNALIKKGKGPLDFEKILKIIYEEQKTEPEGPGEKGGELTEQGESL